MELSIESSCQYVTWKVQDFFELPSKSAYRLDSPEFDFAGDSYCLRLYPKRRKRDKCMTEFELVRLTSTFPERSVSCKLGRRFKDKEVDFDQYWSKLRNKFSFKRSFLQKNRDKNVPDGTLTLLCCMRQREPNGAAIPQSEEAKTSDRKEEQEGLPGQSVLFFSPVSWSSRMELSIESPCQNVTWKVPDFFQRLSTFGYFVNSPDFHFAGESYCLRFYPKRNNNGDTVDTDLQLVRLTSNFPERIVLYKVGYNFINIYGQQCEIYHYSGALIGNFGLCLPLPHVEENIGSYVPDGTLNVFLSFRLKEQSSAGNPQSEEPGNSQAEEKLQGLPVEEEGNPEEQEISENVENEEVDDEIFRLHEALELLQNAKNREQENISREQEALELLQNADEGEILREEEISECFENVEEKENPEKLKSIENAEGEENPEKQESTENGVLHSERMKDLLIKGIEHDVTICVKNKEFRAHRKIFSDRTPVFDMMLAHNTKESNTSTINIKDCEPGSFDEFMLHMYFGRTENLTPSNALQIYYTADKYNFPVLKEKCVNLLKASLSVSLICDVVLLAAKHQEKELLEVATEFFAHNLKEILVTVGWLNFMSQNPVEANELYLKSMETLLPRK